jgi:hypothetical protein
MVFCISFGKINFKYAIVLIFFILKIIYANFIVYEYSEKINDNQLLDLLLTNFGCFLCVIPALISKKMYRKRVDSINSIKINNDYSNFVNRLYNKPYSESLTYKEIINLFIISVIELIIEFCYIFANIINDYDYNEKYFFVEILIWFFFPSIFLKLTFYKHQYTAIIIITIIGLIKTSISSFINKSFDYKTLILEIIIYTLNGIIYGYLKGLMEYKLFSPYKCCYAIGLINSILLIIMYFIVTYAPCNLEILCEEEEHLDNVYSLFENINYKEILILMSYSLLCGIDAVLINSIMNNLTLYHILIVFHIEQFINKIVYLEDKIERIATISYFIAELIFILVFLEIIEINCCKLNKDLKRNIEERAILEAKSANSSIEEELIFVDDEKNYFIQSTL